MRRVILLIALLLATPVQAQAPAWQVCFTPGQDCTGLIVGEIAGALSVEAVARVVACLFAYYW